MGLQQFANSPPDTTTHSPRSPNDILMLASSEKSNGSSEGNNMVSSSEVDSNVVSPECHQFSDSVQSPSHQSMQHLMNQQQQIQYHHHHHSGKLIESLNYLFLIYRFSQEYHSLFSSYPWSLDRILNHHILT